MKGEEDLAHQTQRNVEAIARIESASKARRTRGERISETIARRIGSWPFIIAQSLALIGWMILNVVAWAHHWDPYPFILLNLGLSLQAAFAGPVIMMSQNRQARIIERRHQLDLQIDLLAEQENTEMLRLLRLLCKKTGVAESELGRTKVLSEETKPATLIQQILGSESDHVQRPS